MKNWQRRLMALLVAGALTLSPLAGAVEGTETDALLSETVEDLLTVTLPDAGAPETPFFTIDGYDLDMRDLTDDEVKDWTDADWDAYYDAMDALWDYLIEKEQAEFSYNGKSFDEMTDADWEAYYEAENAAWEAEWAAEQAEAQKATREEYGLAESGISVMLDGKGIQFADAQPESVDGRTMVPFRAITEALGGEVVFHADSKAITAVVNDRTLDFAMGGKKLTVTYADGTTETVGMDAAPYGKDGRVYVPVRFFAQALDFDVKWDGDYKTAVLVNKPAKIAALDEKLTILGGLMKNQKQFDPEQAYRTILELALAGNVDEVKFDLGGKLDILNRNMNLSIDVQLDLEDIAKLLLEDGILDEDMAQKMADALKKGDIEVILNTDEDVLYFKSDMLLSALAAMQQDEPASATYKITVQENNREEDAESYLEWLLEGRLNLAQGNQNAWAVAMGNDQYVLNGFTDESLAEFAEKMTKQPTVEFRDADQKVWLTGEDIAFSNYIYDWDAYFASGNEELENIQWFFIFTEEGEKKLQDAFAAVAERKDGKPLEVVVDGVTIATAKTAQRFEEDLGRDGNAYLFDYTKAWDDIENYRGVIDVSGMKLEIELVETRPMEKAEAFPISGSDIWFKYEGINEMLDDFYAMYFDLLYVMEQNMQTPGTWVYYLCDAGADWAGVDYEAQYAALAEQFLAMLGDDAFVKQGGKYVNDLSGYRSLAGETGTNLTGKLTISGDSVSMNATVTSDYDDTVARVKLNAKQGNGSVAYEFSNSWLGDFKLDFSFSQTETDAEVPAAPPEGATVIDVSELDNWL